MADYIFTDPGKWLLKQLKLIRPVKKEAKKSTNLNAEQASKKKD